MRWKVTGANPTTGHELIREIDAASASEAEAIANAKGLLVSSVEPLSQTCENCGRAIGFLETAQFHEGHVVCPQCKQLLKPEPIGYESVVMSPLEQLQDANKRRSLPSMSEIAHRVSNAPLAGPYGSQEYRALGLNSRGMAWFIAIIGLFTSVAVVGLPLLIWGLVADHMIVQHRKAIKKGR